MAVKNLVIVESPAKIKTITKILGNDYKVMASFGHIRDLPKSKLGFDEVSLDPEYIINKDKQRIVRELKALTDKNTIVYLATDDDAEGEAIAWHVKYILSSKTNNFKRMIFHEITKPAILKALNNTRDININKVNAQQTRRLLDRMAGYKLSPLLWKKIKFGLSAGRVQSVAVRIIVDREEEISSFIPEEFWKFKLDILSEPSFSAMLDKIDNKSFKITNEKEANTLVNNCKGYDYKLVDIEEKDSFRTPPAPFITSTLQQEASRKLGMSVKNTMNIAQKLYEGNMYIPGHTGGLITYMRTDSTNLSDIALQQAKEVITNLYGSEYALITPRIYNKKTKGAQEAHEAIRPANLNLKPSDVKSYLDQHQYKLYKLIWNRTIACQMEKAKVANTIYKIDSLYPDTKYTFIAKGTKILFPGFMKVYTEGNDDGKNDNDEKFLPIVDKGSIFNNTKLTPERNFTKPKSRYTEASLVKKLEKEGIGRPSTYASIISTIISREYIIINNDKRLEPTIMGKVVDKYLKENFPNIVDLKFTSYLESQLDEIVNNHVNWKEVIKNFYNPFNKQIMENEGGERVQYSQEKLLGVDPKTGRNVYVRTGRFGDYIQLGSVEDTIPVLKSSLPKGSKQDTVTLEQALKSLELPKVLGKFNNKDIKVAIGRFGPYLHYDSKFYQLKDKDPYEVTLEEAKVIIQEKIAEQKKALWLEFKSDNISVINGRYGPYIKAGKNNYKLPKGLSEDEIRKLTLQEIKDIITKQSSKPKSKKRKRK